MHNALIVKQKDEDQSNLHGRAAAVKAVDRAMNDPHLMYTISQDNVSHNVNN